MRKAIKECRKKERYSIDENDLQSRSIIWSNIQNDGGNLANDEKHTHTHQAIKIEQLEQHCCKLCDGKSFLLKWPKKRSE